MVIVQDGFSDFSPITMNSISVFVALLHFAGELFFAGFAVFGWMDPVGVDADVGAAVSTRLVVPFGVFGGDGLLEGGLGRFVTFFGSVEFRSSGFVVGSGLLEIVLNALVVCHETVVTIFVVVEIVFRWTHGFGDFDETVLFGVETLEAVFVVMAVGGVHGGRAMVVGLVSVTGGFKAIHHHAMFFVGVSGDVVNLFGETVAFSPIGFPGALIALVGGAHLVFGGTDASPAGVCTFFAVVATIAELLHAVVGYSLVAESAIRFGSEAVKFGILRHSKFILSRCKIYGETGRFEFRRIGDIIVWRGYLGVVT